MYQLTIDEPIQAQLDALPTAGQQAWRELRAALELAPWNGEPLHPDIPEGVLSWQFGPHREASRTTLWWSTRGKSLCWRSCGWASQRTSTLSTPTLTSSHVPARDQSARRAATRPGHLPTSRDPAHQPLRHLPSAHQNRSLLQVLLRSATSAVRPGKSTRLLPASRSRTALLSTRPGIVAPDA